MRAQLRTRVRDDPRTFLGPGKSAKNSLRRLFHVVSHQLESEKLRKTLLNAVLGENLEELHRELENQRSARQTMLLNSVLGENLEDDAHHQTELERRRSRNVFTWMDHETYICHGGAVSDMLRACKANWTRPNGS